MATATAHESHVGRVLVGDDGREPSLAIGPILHDAAQAGSYDPVGSAPSVNTVPCLSGEVCSYDI